MNILKFKGEVKFNSFSVKITITIEEIINAVEEFGLAYFELSAV